MTAKVPFTPFSRHCLCLRSTQDASLVSTPFSDKASPCHIQTTQLLVGHFLEAIYCSRSYPQPPSPSPTTRSRSIIYTFLSSLRISLSYGHRIDSDAAFLTSPSLTSFLNFLDSLHFYSHSHSPSPNTISLLSIPPLPGSAIPPHP